MWMLLNSLTMLVRDVTQVLFMNSYLWMLLLWDFCIISWSSPYHTDIRKKESKERKKERGINRSISFHCFAFQAHLEKSVQVVRAAVDVCHRQRRRQTFGEQLARSKSSKTAYYDSFTDGKGQLSAYSDFLLFTLKDRLLRISLAL